MSGAATRPGEDLAASLPTPSRGPQRRRGFRRGLLLLHEVLLGFATVESTALQMLEAARPTVDLHYELDPGKLGPDVDYDRLQALADEDGFVSPDLAWAASNSVR